MNKQFKPILAPNDQPNLDELNYPLFASTKLDGIRCLFYKGQILSRSLKQIQNKQLRERFEPLRKFSENNTCILDGELYAPGMSFQSITHYVMTQDLKDEVLPESLKFYCFDSLHNEEDKRPFHIRIDSVKNICDIFLKEMIYVYHELIENQEEIEIQFEKALKEGYEGLILRSLSGQYKFGRGTIKEGIIYKVKPFLTFDAQITDVVQSTEVREDTEKKINELGRSVTSKKKEDRILIEKASAFWVKYEGKPLKVTLALTDEQKIKIWKNRKSYIRKWIEYKGMLVGAKDVPRHPVFIRYRKDKDV